MKFLLFSSCLGGKMVALDFDTEKVFSSSVTLSATPIPTTTYL